MNDATKGAITLGTVFALGLGTGWMLWRPKPTPQAKPRPAIQQADGSQVVEVKPDANAKPPHQIPHDGTVEDLVHVTVQPNPPAVVPLPHPGSAVSAVVEPARPPCPPVTVDLSLVRMEDGTRRVVASSPDGQIIGAVHIPVEAAKPQPKVLLSAVGLDYTVLPWGDVKSLVVQRTWGPVTIGAHAGVATIAPPGGGLLRGGSYGVTALIRF